MRDGKPSSERLAAVLAKAREVSRFTIDHWRTQCGLPASRRCTLHRALNGGACADTHLRQRLFAVAARVLGVPTDDVIAYVELGESAAGAMLPSLLFAETWLPDPRSVCGMFERINSVERFAKRSVAWCSTLPSELTTRPLARAHDLAIAAGASNPSAVTRALSRFAALCRRAMDDDNQPRHSTMLLSLRGLVRMVHMRGPFRDCRRRDVNECIETLRFVHMERRNLAVHVIDDRRNAGGLRDLGRFDLLRVIDEKLAVRQLRTHPEILLVTAATSPAATTTIAAERLALEGLASESCPFRLDAQCTKQLLVQCLSRQSWYRRRRGD